MIGLHEYIPIRLGHCSAETLELNEEKGFNIDLVQVWCQRTIEERPAWSHVGAVCDREGSGCRLPVASRGVSERSSRNSKGKSQKTGQEG